MFAERLETGRLVAPFPAQIATGRYWLTRPAHKRPTPAMTFFQEWLLDRLEEEPGKAAPMAAALSK